MAEGTGAQEQLTPSPNIPKQTQKRLILHRMGRFCVVMGRIFCYTVPVGLPTHLMWEGGGNHGNGSLIYTVRRSGCGQLLHLQVA